MDEVGCRTFFVSGLISMFVFDILQICGGCIEICSMGIVPSCNFLATGLTPPHMCTNPHLQHGLLIPVTCSLFV